MKKNLTDEELELHFQDERFKAIEQDLDYLAKQVLEIKSVIEMQNSVIRELQQFAIKVGVAQNRISERVLKWPYVEVSGDREK
jgi:predicted DNA-binding protein (UPF0278 family)